MTHQTEAGPNPGDSRKGVFPEDPRENKEAPVENTPFDGAGSESEQHHSQDHNSSALEVSGKLNPPSNFKTQAFENVKESINVSASIPFSAMETLPCDFVGLEPPFWYGSSS